MGGEGGGLGLSPLSRSRSYIMSDPIERVRFRVLGGSWGGREGPGNQGLYYWSNRASEHAWERETRQTTDC